MRIPEYSQGDEIVTTIKLKEQTKKELDTFREYKNETYDEIIRRVLYIAKNVEIILN